MSGELPFGAQFRFSIVVPAFVTGNDHRIVKIRGGRRIIAPGLEVKNFKKHVALATQRVIGEARRQNTDFATLQIPIPGKVLIRLDLYFGFHADDDGSYRRMSLSDGDNLRKSTQDALQGVLFDNDRYITEGYTAIGKAPDVAEGDVIWVVLSRAGYRTGEQMELLYRSGIFGTLPPWHAVDQGGLIIPPKKLIIPPGPRIGPS